MTNTYIRREFEMVGLPAKQQIEVDKNFPRILIISKIATYLGAFCGTTARKSPPTTCFIPPIQYWGAGYPEDDFTPQRNIADTNV